MTEELDHEAIAALIQHRLDEGRAAGRYSDELDQQLASQFHRVAVDPLTFPALEALRNRVERFAVPSASHLKVRSDSSIPGGREMHRLVAKLVDREVGAVMAQMTGLATEVRDALAGVVAALDEMRAIVTTEVFGDIDSVHHRMVAAEQRIARLEAGTTKPIDD